MDKFKDAIIFFFLLLYISQVIVPFFDTACF